ncbi:EthD family reductase [Hazenella coriacea]|uniref:Uncharacterized protein (TIGR02118 family) n=1 Tax=Hazenella coriacea TaxID=1179467 RepID=A0A4V2UUP4_9BACL|nr:EthD family reductase [Hazenella coriacea]TCS91975.1 uncharacterized protein (TIGR02118 family) [Hazenella coriacea]
MFKIVGLYRVHNQNEGFEQYYVNELVPRLLEIPGVIKVEVTRLAPSPFHDTLGVKEETPYFMQGDMYFESAESLQEALSSPEGIEVARLIIENAFEFVTLYVGDSYTFHSES